MTPCCCFQLAAILTILMIGPIVSHEDCGVADPTEDEIFQTQAADDEFFGRRIR